MDGCSGRRQCSNACSSRTKPGARTKPEHCSESGVGAASDAGKERNCSAVAHANRDRSAKAESNPHGQELTETNGETFAQSDAKKECNACAQGDAEKLAKEREGNRRKSRDSRGEDEHR